MKNKIIILSTLFPAFFFILSIASYGQCTDIAVSTGSDPFCYTGSIVLTYSGPAGTGPISWSSSDPSVASVPGSSTVNCTVNGVSPGTANITYYDGTYTCAFTVHVDGNPDPISGAPEVCRFANITLTDATSGGTWSSSSGVASVTSGGVVTGNSVGSVNITYTISNSCGSPYVIHPLTVRPLPSAGTITVPGSVCVGSTITLTNGVPGGTWSCTSGATINSSTGVLTGVSAGTETAYYTTTNVFGCTNTSNASVTVLALPTMVAISGSVSAICTLLTTNLTYSGTPTGTWSASSGLASVSPTTGSSTLVTAGSTGGTVDIIHTVTSGGCSDSRLYTLVIEEDPIASVITGNPIAGVCVGLTAPLASTGTPGGTWSSFDPTRATVNATTGLVTAVAQGFPTIQYSVTNSCGNDAKQVIVTVNPLPNAGAITGPTAVCAGSTINLGNPTGDPGGTWSSDLTAVATVSSVGVVTGVAGGTVLIRYTVTNVCGTIDDTHSVTVTPIPSGGTISGPADVCMGDAPTYTTTGTAGTWSSGTTATANINSTSGLLSTVAPGTSTLTYTASANACGVSAFSTYGITVHALPSAPTISGTAAVCEGGGTTALSGSPGGGAWSTDPSTVAYGTVDVSGVVTGLAYGTTDITYTVTDVNGCQASDDISVVVNPLPAAITGTMEVCVGLTTVLSDATVGGTWSSGTTGVATVASGTVTGVAGGTSTISYTLATGCGATAIVTVNALPTVDDITGTASICDVAGTTTLTSAPPGGVWTSDNVAIATVGTSSGLVTGVALGNTDITYTVTDGVGCIAFKILNVTVNALPSVSSITGLGAVCVAATITASCTSTPGIWSSSAPTIGSIDASTGVITGIANGTTTITYTHTDAVTGCSDFVTGIATVNPLPNAGVISGSDLVCVSATTTLSETVGGGTWSSSDPSIGSIDASGVVTGIANGSITISYTVTGGGCTNVATFIEVVGVHATITNGGTFAGPYGAFDAIEICQSTAGGLVLTGYPAGGLWSTSSPSVTSIGSTSGIVYPNTSYAIGNTIVVWFYYTTSNTCGSTYAERRVIIDASAATITTPHIYGPSSAYYGAVFYYTLNPYTYGTEYPFNNYTYTSSTGGSATYYTPYMLEVHMPSTGTSITLENYYTNTCGTFYSSFGVSLY